MYKTSGLTEEAVSSMAASGEEESDISEGIRPRSEIEEDVRLLKEEESAFGPRADELVDRFPEDAFREVREVLDRKYYGGEEDISLDEIFSQHTEHEDLIHELVEMYDEIEVLRKRSDQLKREHKPYLVQDLIELSTELATRVDYDAVLVYYNSGKREKSSDLLVNAVTESNLAHAIQTACTEGHIADQDYDIVDMLAQTLGGYKDRWGRKGFLVETTADISEDIEVDEGRLIEEMQNTSEQLGRYKQLSRIYKPSLLGAVGVDHKINDVVFAITDKPSYSITSRLFGSEENDPRFVAACERFYRAHVAELSGSGVFPMDAAQTERYVAERVSIDEREVYESVKVEMVAPPEGNRVVVDEEYVKSGLFEAVPAPFLIKVELIIGAKKPEGIDLDDPDVETIGKHNVVVGDNGEWVSSKLEIYKKYCVPEGVDNDDLEEALQRGFLDVAYHEDGHVVHYGLTRDEMEAWEKVMEQDSAPITWYVQYSNNISTHRGKREDFCESYKMFCSNPGWLSWLSEDRFFYMRDLFRRYTKPEERLDIDRKLEEKMDSNLKNLKYDREGFVDVWRSLEGIKI